MQPMTRFLPLVYRNTDIFGIDECGNSHLLHIKGWSPNFVVRATTGKLISQQVQASRITPEASNSVDYYEFEPPCDNSKFYNVTFRTTWDANVAKRNLIKNSSSVRVYDGHLCDASKMFVQCGIRPCQWLDATRFQQFAGAQTVTGSIDEHTCAASHLHTVECPQQEDCPMTAMSFDIECDTTLGFPKAERDSILQIGVVVWSTGKMENSVDLHAFMLETEDGRTDAIPPDDDDDITNGFTPEQATVHSYGTEMELLLGFQRYIRNSNPDIITGYNINGFDIPYVSNRYNFLRYGTTKRPPGQCGFNWSRSMKNRSEVQCFRRGSEKLINSDRIILDAMKVIKADHKLRSYKLDSVCKELLNTSKKHDVAYDEIGMLQRTREGRGRMMRYCLKDCWLVTALLERLCKITNAVQMSVVSGVFLQDVLDRGGQLRVLTSMYYELGDTQVRLPNDIPRDAGTYQGATVLDPIPGLYEDAISVVDFASLYPSIMREYNMSPDTLIDDSYIERNNLTEDQYTRIPDFVFDPQTGEETRIENENNPIFLNTSCRKGVLISLLEQYLSARKEAKNYMRAAKTDQKRMIWNGTQLAYKVLCNTVYGFLGATGSMAYLPESRIAACITKVGRDSLMRIKNMAEHLHVLFPRVSWPPWTQHIRVIYGDTDSVFMQFPKQTNIAKVEEVSEHMSELFTIRMANDQSNPKIVLEYEKTYCPFLLQCKKRYAGRKFEPGRIPTMHCSGIELARRDFAPVVNETMGNALNALLMQADTESCIDIVRAKVKQLYRGDVNLEDVIITKQLSKDPDAYTGRVIHVELAKRIGNARVGDRIPYVITTTADKNTAAWERAMSPEEVKAGAGCVDYMYYIDNQLKEAMLRILRHVVPHADLLFLPPVETSGQQSIVACMGGPKSPSGQCKRMLQNGKIPGVTKRRRVCVNRQKPQSSTLTKWLKM